jgi:hypothetical protein
MNIPSQFYDAILDTTKRTFTIILDQQSLPEEEIVSDSGTSSCGILVADDGLPYVCDVTILDPNKVSVIQDWLEEAIEDAVSMLNARKGDEFEKNHWKGFRGGTEQGRLSSVTQ